MNATSTSAGNATTNTISSIVSCIMPPSQNSTGLDVALHLHSQSSLLQASIINLLYVKYTRLQYIVFDVQATINQIADLKRLIQLMIRVNESKHTEHNTDA
jgi:hypothetical protein